MNLWERERCAFLGEWRDSDIILYVEVAMDADEGFHDGIVISATSDTDHSRIEFISFNLTVILPNIRVSNETTDFYIDPDSGIEEDDSIKPKEREAVLLNMLQEYYLN